MWQLSMGEVVESPVFSSAGLTGDEPPLDHGDGAARHDGSHARSSGSAAAAWRRAGGLASWLERRG